MDIEGPYLRVVPRDLFNEADLLKCMGRLFIELDATGGHGAMVTPDHVERFEIVQDPSSGSICLANVHLAVDGRRCRLERPLNSRGRWPLLLTAMEGNDDFEEVRVFDEEGRLSADMLDVIGAGR